MADFTPDQIKVILRDYMGRYEQIQDRIVELTQLKEKLLRCASGGDLHHFRDSEERRNGDRICKVCGCTEAHPIHPQDY